MDASFCLWICVVCAVVSEGQTPSGAVVFSEPGFPVADSSASPAQISSLLRGSQTASAEQLPALLRSPDTHLLVLPYGSSFPEAAWAGIEQYLQRGGNLLVVGGRPFTRSAYRDGNGWHLRDYSVRFTRTLMIDQYQATPGSDGLTFQLNPDLPVRIPAFSWKSAFSPVIRLSAVDLYHRGGTAGSIDARVDAIAWGTKDGRKLAAPVIEVDHLRNGFNGGRWIFVNADLSSDFSAHAGEIIPALAARAMPGSEEFAVRPALPLYLPGEPIELGVTWHAAHPSSGPLTIRSRPSRKINLGNAQRFQRRFQQPILIPLPAPGGKGLYTLDAQLMEGSTVRARYHSGFWIRDEAYLRSGPRLTVNQNYFERDGKAFAVLGTTYMSSEAQRLYFEYPNVYLWNQELGQIRAAGLNTDPHRLVDGVGQILQ